MISLICGDCLTEMDKIKDNSIDMVLCDLPYNVTSMKWDCLIPFDELWEQYDRICKPNANIVLFSSGLFTMDLIQSNRKDFKYKLIWHKNVPTGMASAKYRPMKYYEEICVFNRGVGTYNPIMKERVGEKKDCYRYDHYCGDNNHIKFDKQKKRYDPDLVQPSDVLNFKVVPNRKGKIHPTEKPVDILEYLIKTYSKEGDTILDNCAGSFSAAVAAMKTRRNFIGIEKDFTYFDKGFERVSVFFEKYL